MTDFEGNYSACLEIVRLILSCLHPVASYCCYLQPFIVVAVCGFDVRRGIDDPVAPGYDFAPKPLPGPRRREPHSLKGLSAST
jgi:hypothetical protein